MLTLPNGGSGTGIDFGNTIGVGSKNIERSTMLVKSCGIGGLILKSRTGFLKKSTGSFYESKVTDVGFANNDLEQKCFQ